MPVDSCDLFLQRPQIRRLNRAHRAAIRAANRIHLPSAPRHPRWDPSRFKDPHRPIFQPPPLEVVAHRSLAPRSRQLPRRVACTSWNSVAGARMGPVEKRGLARFGSRLPRSRGREHQFPLGSEGDAAKDVHDGCGEVGRVRFVLVRAIPFPAAEAWLSVSVSAVSPLVGVGPHFPDEKVMVR